MGGGVVFEIKARLSLGLSWAVQCNVVIRIHKNIYKQPPTLQAASKYAEKGKEMLAKIVFIR